METQSRGHRIHYIAQGEGEPLVLIPGFLQSIGRWRDVGYVDAFAGDYRVIAIDPLGHGASDKPHEPGRYLLPDVAADVVAVLDAEEIDAAHVWGYSRGAQIACLVATLFPERVRSLIVGGNHIAPLPEAAWKAQAETAPERAGALRRGDWDEFFRLFSIVSDPEAEALLRQVNDPVAMAAVVEGSVLSGWVQYNLSSLRGRILAYGGSEEPLLKIPGVIDVFQADCEAAGARSEVLPGLTHVTAFLRIDVVEPLVRQHLAALAPTTA